jgi:hypothetical protein
MFTDPNHYRARWDLAIGSGTTLRITGVRLYFFAFFLAWLLPGVGHAAVNGGFAPFDGVPWRYTSTGRTVSIGDLHADPDAFLDILLQVGVIDAQGHLVDRTRLILLGDIPSRGPGSRFIFDFLEHLRDEANARFPESPLIVSLVGNHELLRITGDDQPVDHRLMKVLGQAVRYPETTSFQYLDLIATRALPFARAALQYQKSDMVHLVSPDALLDPMERLYEIDDYAYYNAFTSAQSPIAQAIRQHDTIVQEDETLFVHAGIDSWMGEKNQAGSVGVINSTVRRYIGESIDFQSNLLPFMPSKPWVVDVNGPHWMRRLAQEEVEDEHLAVIMRGLGVKRIVIGHERNKSGIVETRYAGRIYRTDTGISRFARGSLSAMEFKPNEEPKVYDQLVRTSGVHPIRAIWEPLFAAERARRSPAVAELQRVIGQIHANNDNCAFEIRARADDSAAFSTDFNLDE